MRSLQVSSLTGPDAVKVVEIDPPQPNPTDVLVEVKAVGISWPDLLQTKGEYQIKPDLPFQLGVDFAGVVRSAPQGSGFAAGDRVACCLPYGGGAELVAINPESVFALPDAMSFEQGAALPMNYLTAEFALATRGGITSGDVVVVNGAAGGVGTASIQVAKALGATTIAVVSTAEKAEFVTEAGADHALLADGFLAGVREITAGAGATAVLDVVGEPLVTDSLRCLGAQGRLLIVGFTGGQIPQVKLNRLLLNNIDVRGVGWGAYAMMRPGYMRAQWERLVPQMISGVINPPIGARYEFEDAASALAEMEDRLTLGKSILVL